MIGVNCLLLFWNNKTEGIIGKKSFRPNNNQQQGTLSGYRNLTVTNKKQQDVVPFRLLMLPQIHLVVLTLTLYVTIPDLLRSQTIVLQQFPKL